MGIAASPLCDAYGDGVYRLHAIQVQSIEDLHSAATMSQSFQKLHGFERIIKEIL